MKKRNTEPKTTARIVHALPGRIRFRLPGKKLDNEYFQQLFSALRDISGVNKLIINPRTASVFIHYDPEATDILNVFLEGNDFFVIDQQKKDATQQDDSFSAHALYQNWAKKLSNSTTLGNPEIPPTTLMAAGLAGWSCYKLIKGEWKSPAWYVTLWYSYNLYKDVLAKKERSSLKRDI